MVEWFRTFVSDKSFFESTVRLVLVGVGGAIENGQLPIGQKYWWLPVAAAVLVSTKK